MSPLHFSEQDHNRQDYKRQNVLRRTFLKQSTLSLGTIALSSMLGEATRAAGVTGTSWNTLGLQPAISGTPHLPPHIKRVIFLSMSGGPSQFETFDHKPKLDEMHGQPMPTAITTGQPVAQLQGHKLLCQKSMFRFNRYGKSGQQISELFPHLGRVADDICIIRSMHTDQINHDPANTVMNTGTSISGRPSMGSWLLYGLGSESANLPGFVVLTSKGGRNPQPIATRQWHSGFLPGRYQGVEFYSQGDPVHFVKNPPGVDRKRQRQLIDSISQLNKLEQQQTFDPEIETRINQYEMAFQMQASVPELMDISDEPRHVLEMYGASGADGSYAYNCLLARRLAERGVRFIQLYHRGWDHHNDLKKYMKVCTSLCDQPTAALIQDLKQRDMLKETLIVWTGEFGRTPMAQSNKGDTGRDHHMRSFSLFLCGGNIRGGQTYGATDELGYHAVENPVHVNDLHATMLHLLGLDHKRLTFLYQGRKFRLTDIAGEVVREILV